MAAPSRIQTLSIGSQTLSVALFSTGKRGGLMLEKLNFRSLPSDPAAEAARAGQFGFVLEELARASDLKVRARCALSGQSVFTRFVKLPPMGEGKVDQIVEFEAQQNVPFPIAEVIWDYQLFTDGATGETEVALVAIKADMLNQLNEQIEESGFSLETVDVSPMALLNAFRFNYPDVSECCMLIDIGARTTNLVFSEQGRVFARSLPIGGSSVTSAIAKEFQIPFEMAEEKKCRDCFVALGGGYAEHPDPNLAAMARVARSSMTRLHAEIVRTINYYRSTLGGNQPRMAMLCGGGASMAYTKEFFEEKLGLPVDYFNALRNIGISDAVAASVAPHSYKLGEHVGLALRAISACPMEIDLEPDTVAVRREVKEKRPLWLAAAVCLLAGSAAMAAHGHFAKEKAANRAAELNKEATALRQLSTSITAEFKAEEAVNVERLPMLEAMQQRKTWPELIAKLNTYFASDVLWVTDVEPLTKLAKPDPDPNASPYESVLTDAVRFPKGNRQATAAAAPKPDESEGRKNKSAVEESGPAISHLRIRGLWRGSVSNPDAGQDKAREIFKTIREDKESPFLTENLDEVKDSKFTGRNEEAFAWPFEMTLPLKSPIPLD